MSQGPYSGRCMTCGHDHSNDRTFAVASSFSAEIDEVRQALSQAYFLVTGRSPAFSETFGTNEALADIDDACRLLRESAKSANPSTAMPNLDGDWSPVSETLVHRLRDPIPPSVLADMPERMAEALNVIGNEAADAIESLAGQFREIEYLMECGNNASRPTADESAKPVGVVSVTEMDGWHMEPFIGWEEIGYGTKLYAESAFAASKEAVTLSDEERLSITECISYLLPAAKAFADTGGYSDGGGSKHARCIQVLRRILKRDASKAEGQS